MGPLAGAMTLTAVIFFAELIGGWWTGSLALVADAAHAAMDVLGLGLMLCAAIIARMPADPKRTYGYRRVEVLAALGNAVALLVATGFLLREAWQRWNFPAPVAARPMIAIAALGLACNLSSAAILWRAGRRNINARGALLHVLSDGAGSLSAVIAGVLILRFGWNRADAAASAIICAAIIFAAAWLLRDSVHILMEGAPAHLDLEAVRAALGGLEGVREVHDLHLWSVTQGQEAMSGHLVVDGEAHVAGVLKHGRRVLSERFGIKHVTLQVETDPC